MKVIKSVCGIEIQLYINDKEIIDNGNDLFSRFNSGPGLFFKISSEPLKDRFGQSGFKIEAFPLEVQHELRDYYIVCLSKEKWEKLVAQPYSYEANHFGTRTLFDRVDTSSICFCANSLLQFASKQKQILCDQDPPTRPPL